MTRNLVFFSAAFLGCFAALLSAPPDAQAVLIAADAFSVGAGAYANGQLLGQTSTTATTGFTNAWSTSSGTTNAIRAETGGLTHPLALGEAAGLAGFNNNVPDSQARTVNRFIDTYNKGLPTYYISSLMRANSVGSETPLSISRMGLGLQTSSTTSGGGQIEWGFAYDDLNLWLNGSATTLLPNYNVSETYLLTLQVEVDAAPLSNELITATLYNSSGAEVTSAVISTANITMANLDYLRIGALSNGAYVGTPDFDNFRFGTTLGDVMFVPPVPEPASLTLLSLGSVLLLRKRRRK